MPPRRPRSAPAPSAAPQPEQRAGARPDDERDEPDERDDWELDSPEPGELAAIDADRAAPSGCHAIGSAIGGELDDDDYAALGEPAVDDDAWKEDLWEDDPWDEGLEEDVSEDDALVDDRLTRGARWDDEDDDEP